MTESERTRSKKRYGFYFVGIVVVIVLVLLAVILPLVIKTGLKETEAALREQIYVPTVRALIVPSVFVEKCLATVCQIRARKILSQIDPRTNPCDDFYRFACGKHVNRTYDVSLERKESLLHISQKEIAQMYSNPIDDDDHASIKLVKKVYKACMNLTEIENDYLVTLKEMLNVTSGGWPLLMNGRWNETQFDWLKATYALRNLGYEFSIFLDLNVRTDPRNSSRSIFQVRIPFDLDEATDSVSHKKAIIKRICLAFGVNIGSVSKELKRLYAFAEDITDQMLDHRGLSSYPILTIQQLQKTIGSINWLEYVNTLAAPLVKVSEDDSIIVVEEDSIRRRIHLLQNTSKRTQANYLILKVIRETLPFLTPVMQDLLSEEDGTEPRSDFCQQEIEKRFSTSPVDVLYARKFATKDKKRVVEELIDKMGAVFLKSLQKNDWLSKVDKENVEDKIRHLNVIVGERGNYFDDSILDNLIRDYSEPENEEFLNLISALNRNYVSINYAKISTATKDRLFQKKSLALSDVYYYPELNLLRVPTTQMKMQTFGSNEPSFVKYSTIGKQLGKELSGLLKSTAGYFDAFGNKVMGWSDETSEKHGKISECLINSVENFKKITFDFMTIEMQNNVAGVKLAYDTFLQNTNGDFSLDGVEYNTKQLFWISAVDCYANNTEEYDLSNLPDTSDFPQNIVYATVRNNPNFAEDFECPANSVMNPSSKCLLL